MPEISRFLGIVVTMFFNDHAPPHFHVKYNDFRASIGIKDFSLLEGHLPPRVMGLVTEWAELHAKELLKNWESLKQEGKFSKIKPLT